MNIPEVIVVNTSNNWSLYFLFNLDILSHNAKKKEKLMILHKLTKTSKENNTCFLNINKKKAKPVVCSKFKLELSKYKNKSHIKKKLIV